MRDFKIIGHRGACAHEPENTLRSIRRAIADGAGMVEIDVRFASGEIVVIHDATVDRTTDGKGSLHTMSFAEIRKLDAGKGEKVPKLAEVIETVRGKCSLNIEIKELDAVGPVCDLLEGFGDPAFPQFLLSSSHAKALVAARRRLPGIPIGVIVGSTRVRHEAMFTLAERLRAVSMHPHLRWVTPGFVAEAHGRNLKAYPFTVRTRGELVRLLASGADGCFADDPRWAMEVVDAEPERMC